MTRNETMLIGAVRAIIDRRQKTHRLPYVALSRDIAAELGGNMTVRQVEKTADALASINPETIIFGHTLNDTYCALPDIGFGVPDPPKPNNENNQRTK